METVQPHSRQSLLLNISRFTLFLGKLLGSRGKSRLINGSTMLKQIFSVQLLLKSVLIILVFMLGACASTPPSTADGGSSGSSEQTANNSNPDKLEPLNRKVFAFNDTMDRWLLKPVAKGYRAIVPGPVKSGVGNFFDNLGEVSNIVNSGLQWKWGNAAHSTGRLLMNSTVGVLGVFDVATLAGLEEKEPESFGQTLGQWGVPRGSYLVLPFLGPSTIRGGVSLPAEWVLTPHLHLDDEGARWAATSLDFLHTRYELLDAEEFASGDRYIFIREAYLQRLNYKENDGQVEDDFGGEFDDEYGFDDYE